MPDKAIFLDRDNTLMKDPGYINHPDQVKLLPGAAEALDQFKLLEYKLIVVSNQSAVARGIVTEKVLQQIHNRLQQLLRTKGSALDGIYYCPYHPAGTVEKYRRESDLRKPNPGMLLQAAEEMDIDLSQSWMVGDSYDDVTAGRRAGCKTILINPPSHYTMPKPGQLSPDYQAVNIKEAANIIKRYSQLSKIPYTQYQPEPSNAAPALPEKVSEEVTKQPVEAPAESLIPSQTDFTEEKTAADESQQILREILAVLKSLQRRGMYEEFSAFKLIAGILQLIVFFCLLLSIWFLLDTSRQSNSVLIALGFSAVFQLMSLTLYIMHSRK